MGLHAIQKRLASFSPSHEKKQEVEVGLAGAACSPGGMAEDCPRHLWKERETLEPTGEFPSRVSVLGQGEKAETLEDTSHCQI